MQIQFANKCKCTLFLYADLNRAVKICANFKAT